MSRLETTAKPYLLPGFRGHGCTIHGRGQEALAAWAFKTALVAAQVFRGEATGVPTAHYAYLRDHATPPPDVAIWIAAYSGPDLTSFRAQGMAVSAVGSRVHDGDTPNLYVFTFHVGPFAFQVFGVDDRSSIRIDPAETRIGDLRVRQLWPPQGRAISWSPSAGLSATELETLADAINRELRRHMRR